MVSTGKGRTPQPIAARQWSSGFLPSKYQGVQLRSQGDPVLYLTSPDGVTRERQGADVAAILQDLPSEGPLFPYLARVRCRDRATEVKSRCRQLDFKGVILHTSRYAGAGRAKMAGYPLLL